MEQESDQKDLKDQDRRHAIHKMTMSCFVTKSIHSNNGTYASANYCNDKKGCFRNPEGPFFRFVFINAHQCKADEVHSNKILKE